MELFGKLKKFFDGELDCPACEGKGKLPKPKKDLDVVLHTDPEKASVEELAAMMLMVSSTSLLERIGIDPATVRLELKFESTGHKVSFSLKRKPTGESVK